MRCNNVTLSTAMNAGGPNVSAIMIFQSRIERIPDWSFLEYGKSLTALNMHDCGVAEISGNAFVGLTYLRKLGLPYNNVTRVREQWFADLISLEQLDLSYNLVASIEPTAFGKLRGLKRLDVRGNRLTCLEPSQLAPMAGLEKLRFSENPLTFRCRGTVSRYVPPLSLSRGNEKSSRFRKHYGTRK